MIGTTELDRRLEAAQAALLARYAPDTRVSRIRWSQGETQLLELGSGPPLLLMHGGLGSVCEWVPILAGLAQHHHVFAVDRPGHGLADPYDYASVDFHVHARTFLRDILDTLQLPTVDIVANSIGGMWSVLFAIAAPGRVARLALVGMPAGIRRALPLRLRLIRLPMIGQWIARFLIARQTRERNRKLWGNVLVAHPQSLDDTLLDADVAHQRRNLDSMLGLLHCFSDLSGFRGDLLLGDRWQALQVPTALLWGERDAFGPAELGEDIAARNPQIRLIRIADAGHLPWFDHPHRVLSEVQRFFEATGSSHAR